MKLVATKILFFLLTAGIAFAQAGGISASSAPPSTSMQQSESIKITRGGSQTSGRGPAESFTGVVRIEPLFHASDPARTSGARVTFEPGARTAWHTHPLGQTLIVTEGTGWVQQWGGQKQEIRKGDVVWIPSGQKHWHGATATTGMTHIAIVENLNARGVEWMEKVSDEQYNAKPTSTSARAIGCNESSLARKLFGDFDPKLAEITDNVLFGDVWERPELSKRDRSLITVAALIALDRPEQLQAHLQRARENGVTRDEVIEVITHLAFYAGWPNAVNAITIAKETFQ